MRKILYVLSVLFLGWAVYYVSQTETKVEAQSPQRLQLQFKENILNSSFPLISVCDTANGNLLYVSIGASGYNGQRNTAMAVVPNGCAKNPR